MPDTQTMELGDFLAQYTAVAGMTIAVENHGSAGADYAPFFAGLPDDRCQCPHWGVVLEGEIRFEYDGQTDIYRTGQAYHARPGHLPSVIAGTRVVEVSPTDELAKTQAVVARNIETSGAFA